MAATKTLKTTTKAAFTNAGISLTPAQEHVAAEAEATGFDWVGLITKLAQIAAQVVPIIIAIFGGSTPKTAVAAGCCDHHACCCDTLKAILHSADVCSKHLCECCCG